MSPAPAGQESIVLATPGARHVVVAGGHRTVVTATLVWKSAVDLDLHCFYRLTTDALGVGPPQGVFGRVKRALLGPPTDGHVFWKAPGVKSERPWIVLTRDAGKKSAAGDHEEQLVFFQMDKIAHALIVANIFAKPWNSFAEYDGAVTVGYEKERFRVPLTEATRGSWCVVARVDNTGDTLEVINVNETVKRIPKIDPFIRPPR